MVGLNFYYITVNSKYVILNKNSRRKPRAENDIWLFNLFNICKVHRKNFKKSFFETKKNRYHKNVV